MSTANEDQVQTLHRQMTQASLDASEQDRKLHDLRADGAGLDGALRGWSESARSLLLAFQGCRGKLVQDGSSDELVERIDLRLHDLYLRSRTLDVTTELDDTVRSWQSLAHELGRLHGTRRDYMLSMAESYQPRIDRSTQLLSQARAEGGVHPEIAEKIRTLQAKRDESLRTYEARRLRYLEAEKELRESRLRESSANRGSGSTPMPSPRTLALGGGFALQTVAASAALARPGQATPTVIKLAHDPRKLAAAERTSPQLQSSRSERARREQQKHEQKKHEEKKQEQKRHELQKTRHEEKVRREELHEQRKQEQPLRSQPAEAPKHDGHIELHNQPGPKPAPHREPKHDGHIELHHQPGSKPAPHREPKHDGHIELHHQPGPKPAPHREPKHDGHIELHHQPGPKPTPHREPKPDGHIELHQQPGSKPAPHREPKHDGHIELHHQPGPKPAPHREPKHDGHIELHHQPGPKPTPHREPKPDGHIELHHQPGPKPAPHREPKHDGHIELHHQPGSKPAPHREPKHDGHIELHHQPGPKPAPHREPKHDGHIELHHQPGPKPAPHREPKHDGHIELHHQPGPKPAPHREQKHDRHIELRARPHRKPEPHHPAFARHPHQPVHKPEEARMVVEHAHEKHGPAKAAPRPPAVSAPSLRIVKLDKIAPWPLGPDNIGRGFQTAAVRFQATGFEAHQPIFGTQRIALGQGVVLSVLPTLSLEHGPSGMSGSFSLGLVSSGGRLAHGADVRAVQGQAKLAVRDAAGALAERLGALGRFLKQPIAELLNNAADQVFARAHAQAVPVHILPPHRLPPAHHEHKHHGKQPEQHEHAKHPAHPEQHAKHPAHPEHHEKHPAHPEHHEKHPAHPEQHEKHPAHPERHAKHPAHPEHHEKHPAHPEHHEVAHGKHPALPGHGPHPHAPAHAGGGTQPAPKAHGGNQASFGVSIDLQALIGSHGAAGRLLINIDVHIPRLIDAHGEIALVASVDTVAHAAGVAMAASVQLTALGSGDHLSEEQRARALEAAHTVHAWIQRHHPRLKALADKSPALHARIGHVIGALGQHQGHLGAAREKLRKGRAAAQSTRKHPTNRHGVTEHHVHQLNAAFARSLEHARTHGHHSKKSAGAALHSIVEQGAERAGVSDRLLRTLDSLAVANSRSLIDPHGGALRNTSAKIDALIGKLRGKAGRELAAGAQEIGGLLSEMSRVAQTAGTAHHLSDFKKLLEERSHDLQHVAEKVAGKSGAHAMKAKGGLAQPSALAKGEKALEQLKKIHPDLEKLLQGASREQLGKELGHLSSSELGKLGELASMLKPEAGKLAKGLEGVGTSALGRLGIGHLGGLGSGRSSGALAAFGSGALGRIAHHFEGELKKNGAKDLHKLVGAAAKGGLKGGVHGAVALLEKNKKSQHSKPAKGSLGTASTALDLSRALAAHGKSDVAAQLKSGGALHGLVEGAQRSHGSGMGGLASHLLENSGNRKLSQAMQLVEGLQKQGHKPHCSLWSCISDRVSSAVSSVSKAVSSTVSAGASLVKATLTTVSSGVSSLAGKVSAGVSSLASSVKKGIGSVAGRISAGAKSLAHSASGFAHGVWDKASALGHAALSSVKKGVGGLAHVVSDKLHSAVEWAGQKAGSAWSSIKKGAGEAWSEAKHLGSGAVDWAKKNAGKAGSWIGEKVKSGLEYVNKTGIVGALGKGLKKGISFLGKVAQYTPMGMLAKKGMDFVSGGGLSKLWSGAKNLAGKAWGGIKAGYKAASGFLQSPAGQLLTTGLSLAASFIPGGMLVKGLIGGAVGAISAMSEGKDWKQVLLSAGSGALTGALPFMKLGPLAKVGIGALQGAAGSLMSGGSFKDALKGAAGGALDSFDPGALGALKKFKSVASVEKLVSGGKLSEIEKMAGPGGKMLGKLEQVMTNPRVRKTIGALEKVGSKGVKAGVWVSGKAAKAQDLLDKAVSMGDKVSGVLGEVQQYAPDVAGFLGDNALGHFVSKVGDYAGKGHDGLDKALAYGHSASDKLSTYRGYLDKGLGYVGVKDPQKAYETMQARKGAAKGDKAGVHKVALEKLEKHKAKQAKKHPGEPEQALGGLKKGKRGARGKKHGAGEHEGSEHEHEEHAHGKGKGKKGKHAKEHKSKLEQAIAKGKALAKKGVSAANKVDHRLEQVHALVASGLDGAEKIQSGLENASALAEKGAEFLGDDSELGQYLMAMHDKAEQVHGYLETGIGYAEKLNATVEKGEGLLHKIPGVGEDGEEDEGSEGESDEHSSRKKRKKHAGDDSPLQRATTLHGKGARKGHPGAGHGEHAEAHRQGDAQGEKHDPKAPPKGHPDAPASSRAPEKVMAECDVAVGQLESTIANTLRSAEEKLKANDSENARSIIERNSALIHKAYEKVNKLQGELGHALASLSGVQIRFWSGLESKIYERSAAAMKKYFDSTQHMSGLTHAEVKKGQAGGDAIKLNAAIAGLRAKVAAAGESKNEGHENVSAELERSKLIEKLTSDARLMLAQVTKLRAKYKGQEGLLKIVGEEKAVQDLLDTLSGWKKVKDAAAKETKEAEAKGEGKHLLGGEHGKRPQHGKKPHGMGEHGGKDAHGNKKDGKHAKSGGMGKSLEHGLSAVDRYKKKMLKSGKKLDANLGKLEKGIGKGIAIGKKIDGGLEKVSGLSEQLANLFGQDSAIGQVAEQVHGAADQGHEKLHSALSIAEKGKKGVGKGRSILESVLGTAQKHHENQEESEAKDAAKELTKHVETQARGAGELVHPQGGRGHPHAHPEHGEHGHRGKQRGPHHPKHPAHKHAHGPHKHGHRPGHGEQEQAEHEEAEPGPAPQPSSSGGAPAAQGDDPATLVHAAASEIQGFTKAVTKTIPQIEKLLGAGQAKEASNRVNAVTVTSEQCRLQLVSAVKASSKDAALHKQALDLQKHYLEVRGHFFTFVQSLHGLQNEVGGDDIDAKKYPDLAKLSQELGDFSTKVGVLGDAKSADSKMKPVIAKLTPLGSDLHKRVTEMLGKYAKDGLGSTYVRTLMAKLADGLKLLGGHGDKKAQAKGDKALGLPAAAPSVNPSVQHAPSKGQQHGPAGNGDAVLTQALSQIGESGRVFADRGAHRGEGDHHDDQEVDPATMDTWLGSGEGAKLFSEVFGAFLPAEGALVMHSAGSAGGHGAHGGGHGGHAAHGAAAHGGAAAVHGGDPEAHGAPGADGEEEDREEQDEPGSGGPAGQAAHGAHKPGRAGRPGTKHRGPKRGPRMHKGAGGKSHGPGGGLLGKLGGAAGKAGHALGGGGFFKNLFDHLQGFADKVGSLAGKGAGLLGKGMHYAEMGEGILNKVGDIAGKVKDDAGKAEGFLDKMGLKGLGGFAGKIGSAAGAVGDKASQGHDLLGKADTLMGEGKKALGAVGSGAGKASGMFGALEKGDFSKALSVFKASRGGAGIDGKRTPDKFRGGNILDQAQRLDGMTRNRMETFLGGDFASVRIHTGPGAAEVTKRYDAEAVTVKDHIFFAPGRFNPGSIEGQKLIAHELTHVQQVGRPNLDVRTAETEALTVERTYGVSPTMTPLNLSQAKPDFQLADGMGAGASDGVHTAKRTRSKGGEHASQDQVPDGEEMLEAISSRVYEILLEEMEHAFESR